MSLRIIFVALISFIVSLCCHSQNPSGISIKYGNDQSAFFSFTENPKIIFEQNEIFFKSTKSSISMPLEEIRAFEYNSMTGINELEETNLILQIQGTELIVSSPNKNINLKIFNLSGLLLFERNIAKGEFFSKNLSPNLYIIKINNHIYKIQIG